MFLSSNPNHPAHSSYFRQLSTELTVLRSSQIKSAARRYGAKYPKISSTSCVGFAANVLIDPFVVGTIARFEVTV